MKIERPSVTELIAEIQGKHPELKVYKLSSDVTGLPHLDHTDGNVYVDKVGHLIVKTGCIIFVEGEVRLRRAITVNTADVVYFIGDTLNIISEESRRPAIGMPAHDGMSYGRWSVQSIDLHLCFALDSLALETPIKNFSIGCYGKLTDWDNISFRYCMNVSIPDCIFNLEDVTPTAVYCLLPDASPASTKMQQDAVYLDEREYKKYLKDKESELLACNSFSEEEYKHNSELESKIIKSLQNSDGHSLEIIIKELDSLLEVGEFVSAICKFIDCNREIAGDYLKRVDDENLLQSLFKRELVLWRKEGIFPLVPLSVRASCCISDYSFAAVQYRESNDNSFGVFMDELNLSAELHDYYYHNKPMRDYKPLVRYLYGVNVWQVPEKLPPMFHDSADRGGFCNKFTDIEEEALIAPRHYGLLPEEDKSLSSMSCF